LLTVHLEDAKDEKSTQFAGRLILFHVMVVVVVVVVVEFRIFVVGRSLILGASCVCGW